MPGNMRGFKTRDEKVHGLKEYVIYWLKNRVCWVRANRRGRVGPHIACCSFNRRRLEDNALLENRSLAETKWQLDRGTIWGINTVEARLDRGRIVLRLSLRSITFFPGLAVCSLSPSETENPSR